MERVYTKKLVFSTYPQNGALPLFALVGRLGGVFTTIAAEAPRCLRETFLFRRWYRVSASRFALEERAALAENMAYGEEPINRRAPAKGEG